MATTTNYSWETPDDADLVKDGAAAMRTLGNSIDTTTKALNPSTTLGDIEYRSSTANTNTRLAVGSTGQVLTVAGGVPTWATPASGSFTTGSSFVATRQQITTATFSNLTTVQSVTITTGTKALVNISAQIDTSSGTTSFPAMSFGITGATTRAASASSGEVVGFFPHIDSQLFGAGTFLVTGLTAGSNVFTLKFADLTNASTASFQNRLISVIDFGS